jgi:L,D-transpeptidase YcbB
MLQHSLKTNQQFIFRSLFFLMLISLIFLLSCKTTKNWEQSQLEPIEVGKIKLHAESKSLREIEVTTHFGELNLPDEDKKMLEKFYTLNAGQLAWFNNKRLSRNVNQLLQHLGVAWTEGVSVEKYNTGLIYEDTRQLESLSKGDATYPALYAHLDIMLTRIYLQYAADLYSGSGDSKLMGAGWKAGLQPLDYPQILLDALRRQQVGKSLEALKPKNKSYASLSENLVRLMRIKDEGGWEAPGNFETLRAGDSSHNVVRIKKYLQKTGDIHRKDSTYIHSQLYDSTLELAVMAFQKRHGLKTDGIAGAITVEQMNMSINYRIGQIRANLERMRWLPENEEQYILVNIPEFALRYYLDNKMEHEMKVVVGTKEHFTPILSDIVKYVVFNPTWNVPPSITSEEMVEKIKADSTFLSRNQFALLKGSYVSGDTIDPVKVDWSEITAENFPYFLVQKPGRINALGQVKFLFPNQQNIYLHDTPAQDIFNEYSRDYSHGCVRLDEPLELAAHLLKGQVSQDSITKIIESGETISIELYEKPVIYLIYQTAWVDKNGELNFRKDIYNFDEITLRELDRQNHADR